MIHYRTESDKRNHYGVSISSPFKTDIVSFKGGILLQTAEGGNQSRILLTPDEATHIIEMLQDNIKRHQELVEKIQW
jgi:hypothetical protein